MKSLEKAQFFLRFSQFSRFPHVETEKNEEAEKIVKDPHRAFCRGFTPWQAGAPGVLAFGAALAGPAGSKRFKGAAAR